MTFFFFFFVLVCSRLLAKLSLCLFLVFLSINQSPESSFSCAVLIRLLSKAPLKYQNRKSAACEREREREKKKKKTGEERQTSGTCNKVPKQRRGELYSSVCACFLSSLFFTSSFSLPCLFCGLQRSLHPAISSLIQKFLKAAVEDLGSKREQKARFLLSSYV